MFYTYSQNNSGGYFKGPAEYMIIEADNAEEANTIAEEHGLYFDLRGDCACCGHRWRPVDDEEGTVGPELYGRPVKPPSAPLVNPDARDAESPKESLPYYLVVSKEKNDE